MTLIAWSDKLALGVATMDDTHRGFVELLNALHAAPDERLAERLDAFIAHTITHFEQERVWMQELDFPPMHCHVNEHEGVLNIMREVRGLLDEGKFEVGRVLARELAPWFENHARGMDAMLAFFLRCSEAGVDPMQVLAASGQAGEPHCAASGDVAGCGHANEVASSEFVVAASNATER